MVEKVGEITNESRRVGERRSKREKQEIERDRESDCERGDGKAIESERS